MCGWVATENSKGRAAPADPALESLLTPWKTSLDRSEEEGCLADISEGTLLRVLTELPVLCIKHIWIGGSDSTGKERAEHDVCGTERDIWEYLQGAF